MQYTLQYVPDSRRGSILESLTIESIMADQYRECPYNPFHKILSKRFLTHLTKCMRQHEYLHFKICQFNWSHHVPGDELEHHEQTCKDRSEDDLDFQDQNQIVPPIDPEESKDEPKEWDLVPPCAAYDPTMKTLNTPIIRKVPPNLTKSGREEFRRSEAERVAKLIEASENKTPNIPGLNLSQGEPPKSQSASAKSPSAPKQGGQGKLQGGKQQKSGFHGQTSTTNRVNSRIPELRNPQAKVDAWQSDANQGFN